MALASVGGFLFGFDNGWWGTILGSQKFLHDYGSCAIVEGVEICNLSTSQKSAGSSVQSGGISEAPQPFDKRVQLTSAPAVIACLFSVYLNNLLGRRLSLIITGFVSIVGVLIEITSSAGNGPARFGQFVAGKVIASIAMGLAANIVPIYLSETSAGERRGFAVTSYQNVMILGVILASGVVYASSAMSTKAAYWIPIGMQLIAPSVMVIGSPFLPESPRWLVWKGRNEEAKAAAQKLFSTPFNDFDAADYVNAIEIAIDSDRAHEMASSWRDLFRGPDLRRLLIAVGIQSLQQAQGSSYMNNYVVSFLQSTGVTNVFPVIMGLYTLYYFAILTGHFLPDMVGRRPILMSTGAFCATCLITVSALVVAYSNPPEAAQKASIALIFLWQIGFGIQSPLIWIVTAESAPTRNREKVQAIAVFLGFGVSLLIASVSPYLQDAGYGNLGGKIGFIWGAFSVVTVVWVFFMVPEMRGFTIEQLDFLFNTRIPTRKFAGYSFATSEGEAVFGSAEDVQEELGEDDVKAAVVATHKAVKRAL
ncbi:general substrate transporter [Paraphaeosphaeria sporulosa]|uniref:General substrate transporter n=1 Tax=Paraphaeosphaeria sporulosa TaxID=1460663 RepID=A0A177C658_9PLEO|nr:general substrate transporter [Paraphaeosphaeria sporulosa]OAG02362.1 general substrate transporter [Paraphaeosphaeria sporulosa]